MISQSLQEYIYSLSYLGIFLWFAFFEQLTPVPEEVSLISIGYISMHSSLNPILAGLVAAPGLLTTDNIFFYLSQKGNRLANKTTGKIKAALMKKIRLNLTKNAKSTLFIMALLPKLRFLSPVVSATLGISWKLFLIVNSIATATYVAAYILFGILFHHQLKNLLKNMHFIQHVIFICLMLIITILVLLAITKWMNSTRKNVRSG